MEDVATLVKTSIVLGCALIVSTTWKQISENLPSHKDGGQRDRRPLTLPHHTDKWTVIEQRLRTKISSLDDLRVFYCTDEVPRYTEH
jgi:hypothetical protein